MTRRQPELDAAVKLIGLDVTGIRSDVSNLADLDRVYAAIKSEKGRLDILFANAGGGGLAPLGQITEEHFDKTFNTNVPSDDSSFVNGIELFADGGMAQI